MDLDSNIVLDELGFAEEDLGVKAVEYESEEVKEDAVDLMVEDIEILVADVAEKCSAFLVDDLADCKAADEFDGSAKEGREVVNDAEMVVKLEDIDD